MSKQILKRISQEIQLVTRANLYSSNLIKGINTWAVPLLRYSGPLFKETREDDKQKDQR